MIIKFLSLLVFFMFYYSLVYLFLVKQNDIRDFPVLRERFGTIMWHPSLQSVTSGEEEHIYCYYPKKLVSFLSNRGEYILHKVNSFKECKDWLGIVIFMEDYTYSEYEKFWWSKEQYVQAAKL